MCNALAKTNRLDEQSVVEAILDEKPFSTSPDLHPVNGNYSLPDEDEEEDEDVEDDLILWDEDELEGDEEEYDVELEDDVDETEVDDDDLVIDSDDDIDEDDDLWKHFDKSSDYPRCFFIFLRASINVLHLQ